MAHFISGLQYADLMRTDDAIAELRRTLQLDPVSYRFAAISEFFTCQLGHEEAGRRQLQKSIELDATFFLPRSLLAQVDCWAGRFSGATAEAAEGLRLAAGLPMARGWAA